MKHKEGLKTYCFQVKERYYIARFAGGNELWKWIESNLGNGGSKWEIDRITCCLNVDKACESCRRRKPGR